MSLKRQVFTGFFWQALEQFGTRIAQFIVSIVLARLLGPEEFGTVALLAIFLFFANLLVDSGFGKALIQVKEVDELDYDSVFYFNLLIGFIFYALLFVSAPVIATFYGKPILVGVLRYAAFGIVLNALNVVQSAILQRRMQFGASFWSSMVSSLVTGIVGIVMAYCGCGIWSLVFCGLIGGLGGTVVRWSLVGWRPHLAFSFARIKKLAQFSSQLLGAWLIGSVVMQCYGPIIGKWYSASDLAFFNRGESFPSTIMGGVDGIISRVAFPALASIQDEKERLLALTRRMMSFSAMLIFPAMIGLAALADPIIRFLLTDKWIAAVPYLQLACISYACVPMNTANLQVIQAKGAGSTYLRLELLKSGVFLAALILTCPLGVLALAAGRVVANVLTIVMNMVPCRRLIGYSIGHQLQDLRPYFLAALLMGLAIWAATRWFHLSAGLEITVLAPAGMLIYGALLLLLRAESVTYVLNLVHRH